MSEAVVIFASPKTHLLTAQAAHVGSGTTRKGVVY
jgi:hypothetical protein